MTKYFTEQNSSGRRVKGELDLSIYGTKSDFKNAAGVDTSKFAEKFHLDNLKYIVDDLDIDQLKNLPTNLSNFQSKAHKLVPLPIGSNNLSDVVKNDNQNVLYNTTIKNVQDKIPDISYYCCS